jgi:hypothetical protein
MKYELKIWFRYVQNKEQEKDFEHYSVNALNVHSAFNQIKKQYFNGYKRIPISYTWVLEPTKNYKPAHSEINDPNFDRPLSELTKDYSLLN